MELLFRNILFILLGLKNLVVTAIPATTPAGTVCYDPTGNKGSCQLTSACPLGSLSFSTTACTGSQQAVSTIP